MNHNLVVLAHALGVETRSDFAGFFVKGLVAPAALFARTRLPNHKGVIRPHFGPVPQALRNILVGKIKLRGGGRHVQVNTHSHSFIIVRHSIGV